MCIHMVLKRINTTVDTALLADIKKRGLKVSELIRQGYKHLTKCPESEADIQRLVARINEVGIKNIGLQNQINALNKQRWANLPAKEVQ